MATHTSIYEQTNAVTETLKRIANAAWHLTQGAILLYGVGLSLYVLVFATLGERWPWIAFGLVLAGGVQALIGLCHFLDFSGQGGGSFDGLWAGLGRMGSRFCKTGVRLLVEEPHAGRQDRSILLGLVEAAQIMLQGFHQGGIGQQFGRYFEKLFSLLQKQAFRKGDVLAAMEIGQKYGHVKRIAPPLVLGPLAQFLGQPTVVSHLPVAERQVQLPGDPVQAGQYGGNVHRLPGEKVLQGSALLRRFGMQGKRRPGNGDVKVRFESFNTPGTEVAPRSDVVGEDFHGGGLIFRFCFHAGLHDLDEIIAIQSLKTGALFRFSLEGGAILAEAGADDRDHMPEMPAAPTEAAGEPHSNVRPMPQRPAPRPPVFGDQPAAGDPPLRAVKPELD